MSLQSLIALFNFLSSFEWGLYAQLPKRFASPPGPKASPHRRCRNPYNFTSSSDPSSTSCRPILCAARTDFRRVRIPLLTFGRSQPTCGGYSGTPFCSLSGLQFPRVALLDADRRSGGFSASRRAASASALRRAERSSSCHRSSAASAADATAGEAAPSEPKTMGATLSMTAIWAESSPPRQLIIEPGHAAALGRRGRRRTGSTNSSPGTGSPSKGSIAPHKACPRQGQGRFPPGASSPELPRRQTQIEIPCGLHRMLTVDPRSPPLERRAGRGGIGWGADHFACRGAIGNAGYESIDRPSTGIKGVRNSLKQYRLYLSAMQVERAIAKVLVHQNRPGLRTNFKSWRICIEEPV